MKIANYIIMMFLILPFTFAFSETDFDLNSLEEVFGFRIDSYNGADFTLHSPVSQRRYLQEVISKKAADQYDGIYSHKSINYNNLLENDPTLWNNLKSKQKLYSPKLLSNNDGLSFLNSRNDFIGISKVKYGYCWGVSTLTRYFAQLAFYNETLEVPVDPAQSGAWILYYGQLIDEILTGHAKVIPGFKNFKEFSSHPLIKLYLKLKVVDLWADRASTPQAIKYFYNSGYGMSDAAILSTVKDIEDRLQRGELPKILFTLAKPKRFLGGAKEIHSVLPIEVSRQNDVILIKTWDGNYKYAQQMDVPTYIKISKIKGADPRTSLEIDYSSLGNLSDFIIAPENDIEMVNILLSLKEFCQKTENAQYCKSN